MPIYNATYPLCRTNTITMKHAVPSRSGPNTESEIFLCKFLYIILDSLQTKLLSFG